jgi:hypothetical protein
MDLEARRDQLQSLAEAQKIDLAPVNELPDDPRLRIAAIATLLSIDPMEALRGTTPVKKLVSEARKRERAAERFEHEELKRLTQVGIEPGRPPRRSQ